jgi:peroxiredoxin
VPTSQQTGEPSQAPQVGFSAPGFALQSMDSNTVNLSDLDGIPLIINFWASWCPPCRAEMPDFEQASREFSSSELQILTVNATNQDSIPNIERFIAEHGLSIPVLLDTNGEISVIYQVHSLPTTFFINSSGVISRIIIGGPIPLSLLRIEANQLIKESD